MPNDRLPLRAMLPLMGKLPDAIVIVDPSGTIAYANAMAQRVFGHSPEAMVGQSVEMLVPDDLRASHRRKREQYEARRTEISGTDLRGLHSSGRDFPLETNIRPIDTDEGPMTVAVVRDVTERLKVEQALRKANEQLSRDLDAAVRIQRSLLPGRQADIAGIDVEWVFEPCDRLGGDSFNVFQFADGVVGFYVLDVSGHGVVAALQAVALTRVLAATWPRRPADPSPAQLLERLNREFPVDPDVPQYFTFLGGTLDPSTGRLRYASAGHPGLIHVPVGGAPLRLRAAGLPIGWFPDAEYDEFATRVAPGDRLYAYSDGVTEAMDEGDREFGVAGVLSSLAQTRGRPLGETLREMRDAVDRWCAARDDDLTLLAIEVSGS